MVLTPAASVSRRKSVPTRAAASTLAAKVFASAPMIQSSPRGAPSLTLTWEDEMTSAAPAAPASRRSDWLRAAYYDELALVQSEK